MPVSFTFLISFQSSKPCYYSIIFRKGNQSFRKLSHLPRVAGTGGGRPAARHRKPSLSSGVGPRAGGGVGTGRCADLQLRAGWAGRGRTRTALVLGVRAGPALTSRQPAREGLDPAEVGRRRWARRGQLHHRQLHPPPAGGQSCCPPTRGQLQPLQGTVPSGLQLERLVWTSRVSGE